MVQRRLESRARYPRNEGVPCSQGHNLLMCDQPDPKGSFSAKQEKNYLLTQICSAALLIVKKQVSMNSRSPTLPNQTKPDLHLRKFFSGKPMVLPHCMVG